MKFLVGLICTLLGTATMAQVPNTFQSGRTASAAEVNENFTDLDTRISANTFDINRSLGGLVFTTHEVQGDGVASFQCSDQELVVSANCNCSGDLGRRNFGNLFTCQVSGNGGVAGCFPIIATFDSSLPFATARLRTVCAAGELNEGSRIAQKPIFGTPSVRSTQVSSDNDARSVEFERAVNDARNAVAAQINALQNR